VQAPRGQQIQPPRGQDEVQTPRGQNDVQVPSGTRSVEIDPSASAMTEGQASPPVGGDETPRCDDGSYNRAAGLCVSEGG
jgi:hypothetical protein